MAHEPTQRKLGKQWIILHGITTFPFPRWWVQGNFTLIWGRFLFISTCMNYSTYMSNGLNLLHPRKDMAEMVIVFCVSLIVPEDVMFAIKSGEHVYQESSFFVSPLSFLRVSWWYQVSMSWCNCSKMSEVLAGAHMDICIYIYMGLYAKTIFPHDSWAERLLFLNFQVAR